MKSAELPVDEAKSAEPAFSDVGAKPKEEEKPIRRPQLSEETKKRLEEARKKAEEERRKEERRKELVSRSQEARDWKPTWLNRESLMKNSGSVDDLIVLARMVNNEGKEKYGNFYTEYLPLASSKRQSVLSSFKKRFNI